MPLGIKTIRLHCLPARQHDRRQYSQSHPHYAADNFSQLPSRVFQVLQQNVNSRSGERRCSDYSQYPGSYVLSFHVGLPRASSLVLPTCRTTARKIDSRSVLFPAGFLTRYSRRPLASAVSILCRANFFVFYRPPPECHLASCNAPEPIRKTIFGSCLAVTVTYIMRRKH